MELYQLRGFAAVAEAGHLTRAADALHVSQPALSAQIKALEDDLGIVLFERHPGGMDLTPAGRELLATAREVIDAAQALRSKARTLGGATQGLVRMGTVADPAFVRLPAVLLAAAQRYPLLDVEITQQVSGDAFARVRDGTLDASFYFGDAADDAVAALALHDFDLVVVAPAAFGTQLRNAPFADLATLPWVLTPPVSSLRVLCDTLFARHGVAPATRVSADNEEVVRALVRSGVGLALMREDEARALADAGSVVVWEGERLSCALHFVWQRRREAEPALRALVELVRSAWARAPVAAAPALRRRARRR